MVHRFSGSGSEPAFGELYAPLGDNLTHLFVSNPRFLFFGLVKVAKSCVRLQEVYLYEVTDIDIADFIVFLALLPNLVILLLDTVRFYCDDDFPDRNDMMHVALASLSSNNSRL